MKLSSLAFSLLALSFVGFVPQGAIGAGVTGVEQRARVNELTRQITWYDDMNQALSCARQRGKPLVWIHMLGRMQGAT